MYVFFLNYPLLLFQKIGKFFQIFINCIPNLQIKKKSNFVVLKD
jgi:hypothetical protein